MSMVWIVLGETGEYSDRSVWVSGVFATEKEAQDAVLAASERELAYRTWAYSFSREFQTLRQHNGIGGTFDWRTLNNEGLWDRLTEKAKQLAGPEPEHELGERWEIEVVELGKWQR